MDATFSIEAWAAFAPGLEDETAWRNWASAPWLPVGDTVSALDEMPAMQRRRVERLGRAALQVAWRCQPDGHDASPMVFATRHGDLIKTHDMLAGLARGEPLSPTQFGLSTHNAIPAQYSIARRLTDNMVVVSAGLHTAEAGILEALALLSDGADSVLLVMFDGGTHDAFECYRDEPETLYAWAWRVVPARAGLPVLSVRAGEPAASSILPHGLDVLRFFLAGDASLGAGAWTRHA